MNNLTGTNWTFIDNIKGINETHEYNLDIVSGDEEVFSRVLFYPDTGLIFDSTQVYTITDGVGSWVDEKYKNVYVVSGEDVTNAKAISMFQGMATLNSGGSSEDSGDDTTGDDTDTPTEELEYKTFDEFFTAVGDAIRTKKGTTDKIKKQNIPSEILSIESGGGGSGKQFKAEFVSSTAGIKATIPTVIMNKKQFTASMTQVIE